VTRASGLNTLIIRRLTNSATTGEGRHLYFRWPDGVEIRNFQVREDLPGLDVRGEGGYVLAPPRVHPNGAMYRWAEGCASQFVAAPKWLLELVIARSSGSPSPIAAMLQEAWKALFEAQHERSLRGRHSAPVRLFRPQIR